MNLDEAAGLDAEIAEKVMEWTLLKEIDEPAPDGMHFIVEDAGVSYACGFQGKWSRWDAWTPKENISDAWQVVEKMQERGFKFYLSYKMFSDGWACSIYVGSAAFTSAVLSQTAPEAICRAALEAVGSQS